MIGRSEQCLKLMQNQWPPFLDTYRTMCLAPQPDFRRVLEDVRAMRQCLRSLRWLARQWPVRIEGKREQTYDIKSDRGAGADEIDAHDRRALRREPPVEAPG
jgi:hypothetical protein